MIRAGGYFGFNSAKFNMTVSGVTFYLEPYSKMQELKW